MRPGSAPLPSPSIFGHTSLKENSGIETDFAALDFSLVERICPGASGRSKSDAGILCVLLAVVCLLPKPDTVGLGATAGLAVAIVGVPVAVGMLGFTAAGILSGSIAAKMMSVAAIANGGGVAAGSLVATFQSIGVAGLSFATKAAITAGGALVGAILR
ncbi:interferon alpha-inducible protein 27-like protein 2A [Paroedura picta]|uniref:interferon alpha-inducible protein 27-like protein 2A n=1 Tax=Paroedura picta TaxID=143630 RepID=UPI0040567B87